MRFSAHSLRQVLSQFGFLSYVMNLMSDRSPRGLSNEFEDIAKEKVEE